MTHRFGRGRGRRTGASSTPEDRLLARLATITDSVWFDPAWDPGVVIQNDAGTDRITSMLSRPVGWTQYTLSGASTPTSPAVATSPNSKRVMSFGGAHYLQGAAALAAMLAVNAPYSEVHVASRTVSATMMRWSACDVASDARVLHYVSAGDNTDRRLRAVLGGASSVNVGVATPAATVCVFSGVYSASAYDAWLNGAPSIAASANTRAPAALGNLIIGGQSLSGGAVSSLWQGLQAGLVIVPSAISSADRIGIQADLAAYYGY